MIDFNSCMAKKPSDLKDDELKGCINLFLFKPISTQTDNELLSIAILREKAHHLNFLEGFTRWRTIGSWREVDKFGKIIKEFPEEKNVQLEVEFKDTPDEKIGNKLINLFNEFNKRIIKERLLYVRTTPIEESTLF